MKVVFFEVDGLLNSPDSEAKAPSGKTGVAEQAVKQLKALVVETGSRIVLTGAWANDWNFSDALCTPDGTYLNKKMDRRGLHILDKTDDVVDWLNRHPNVTDYCVLKDFTSVKWEER